MTRKHFLNLPLVTHSYTEQKHRATLEIKITFDKQQTYSVL